MPRLPCLHVVISCLLACAPVAPPPLHSHTHTQHPRVRPSTHPTTPPGFYPFHWHMAGDATNHYATDCSVHRSFYRCFTLHATSNLLLRVRLGVGAHAHAPRSGCMQ